jgi:peptidoglycan L-alanyl-D-glutamate endopeptidase CwlK
MIDPITLTRIDTLHPAIRAEVKDIYTSQIVRALTSNVFCRFAYTLRTFQQQDTMYAQGRTVLFDSSGKRLGKITNAKGGQSIHNYGLALDIVLINGNSASWDVVKDYDGDGNPDWMEIVNIFKANGWKWGGDWINLVDKPHFEKAFNYNWRDLLAKHEAHDFIPGTTYVNL